MLGGVAALDIIRGQTPSQISANQLESQFGYALGDVERTAFVDSLEARAL